MLSDLEKRELAVALVLLKESKDDLGYSTFVLSLARHLGVFKEYANEIVFRCCED